MAHIKSFGELGGGGSDSSDDGDDMNEYYAGGEKSGQVIRGDPKKKEEGDKVTNLFDKARRSGAVDGTAADLEASSGSFRGAGRTLEGGASQAPSGPINHVITFYRDGIFTVSDGPPRRVDEPANFKFIDSISKGECPEELEAENPRQPVTVNLVRKEEDYKEPEKPKYSAFQGTGRTLASDTAGSSSSAAAAAAAASEGEWEGVNESAPTTSLQLRLADGSRMVARFNHTHRISDIRRFIRASRPEMTGGYQLMTAFPSQLIEDEGRSLEAAGLLNAVIIQKKA